jgi:hypothetical protein
MSTPGEELSALLGFGDHPVSGAVRARAPKRDGHRAQLTVPDELWQAAREVAEVTGTTPNDVVVRFAEAGREVLERRAETADLSQRRWRAYLARGEPAVDAALPTAEEAAQAARALRQDLAGGD